MIHLNRNTFPGRFPGHFPENLRKNEALAWMEYCHNHNIFDWFVATAASALGLTAVNKIDQLANLTAAAADV